jgi:anti-sigma regulatory factor (Ser/Thr protein kinase)
VGASAQSPATVRRAIEAHCEPLGIARETVDALKTIATEACANVVNYAYGDEVEGPLEVDLLCGREALTLLVRDRGMGICPQPETEAPSLKLGLPLIGVLSNRMRLCSERGRGTELEARVLR